LIDRQKAKAIIQGKHIGFEAGCYAETASVLAAIFTGQVLAAPCSAFYDHIATRAASIATHVATSSALQGAANICLPLAAFFGHQNGKHYNT
jgi:hypothetical protein